MQGWCDFSQNIIISLNQELKSRQIRMCSYVVTCKGHIYEELIVKFVVRWLIPGPLNPSDSM